MTAMLGIILIYIYSAFAFLFISDTYFDDGINMGLLNKAGDSICMSLLHCFLSTFNYGMRFGGGIGEFLPSETNKDFNRQAWVMRFFFDISFYLVVIVICLNVIFGIIIDTFAQLREQGTNTEHDRKNFCFICGNSKQEMDRDTDEGFDFHMNYDHNLWNYMYFMIYLDSKSSTDYNGTESYIKDLIDNNNNVWFP